MVCLFRLCHKVMDFRKWPVFLLAYQSGSVGVGKHHGKGDEGFELHVIGSEFLGRTGLTS